MKALILFIVVLALLSIYADPWIMALYAVYFICYFPMRRT
jgi:predicted Co/Zn/Cd cation transporter (cation efflux family)